MPRGPRGDHPGALHHVMARGIERRRIFVDDEDRTRFLSRLSRIVKTTGTRCFAFALMPNHFHLLLETRTTPLSRVMLRLGTCHGMDFNRRHRRVGHLFQNRFKSKVVEDEAGLLAVVRYIHLNPVRALLVDDVPSLATWPWTGHATLMGRRQETFLDAPAVLSLLSVDTRGARRALARWMQAGLADEEPGPDFDDLAGKPAPSPLALPLSPLPEDGLAREIERRRLIDSGWDIDRVILAVCGHLELDPAFLRAGRRTARTRRAREAVAGLAVGVLGSTREAVARPTGVTRQAAGMAYNRFTKWPEDLQAAVRHIIPGADGTAEPG